MSQRLPALSFREVVRTLERLGFQTDHVTGNRYRLKYMHDPRRTTVVPRHSATSSAVFSARSSVRPASPSTNS